MGFLKTIDLENGLTIKNAYFKINYFSGNKDAISTDLYAYVDREASLNGRSYLMQRQVTFTIDLENEDNILKQAYNFIKSQPEFEGAIDVLEDGQLI